MSASNDLMREINNDILEAIDVISNTLANLGIDANGDLVYNRLKSIDAKMNGRLSDAKRYDEKANEIQKHLEKNMMPGGHNLPVRKRVFCVEDWKN